MSPFHAQCDLAVAGIARGGRPSHEDFTVRLDGDRVAEVVAARDGRGHDAVVPNRVEGRVERTVGVVPDQREVVRVAFRFVAPPLKLPRYENQPRHDVTPLLRGPSTAEARAASCPILPPVRRTA
jgi:hypothetical protein